METEYKIMWLFLCLTVTGIFVYPYVNAHILNDPADHTAYDVDDKLITVTITEKVYLEEIRKRNGEISYTDDSYMIVGNNGSQDFNIRVNETEFAKYKIGQKANWTTGQCAIFFD